MKKVFVKEWEEIQDDFYRMNQMSCKPSLKKVPNGYISNEDRSVKWNREQVEKNHKEYQAEVTKLNTEKNKERDVVYQDIYVRIRLEVGTNISDKTTRTVFDHAYDTVNGGGFNQIKRELEDLIELLKLMLKDIRALK